MSEPPLPTADQVRHLLRSSPVFGSLPEPALAALQAQLHLQEVPAGTVVLREGETADRLIVVMSGRLRVTRQTPQGELQLYNELGPGECQGEAGLMLRQPRPADVSALRDSVVAWLDQAGFEALLHHDPVLFNRVFSQALVRYLRHTPKPVEQQRAQTIALVPLVPTEGLQELALALQAALAPAGQVRLLQPQGAQANELDLVQAMRRFDQWEQSAEVLLIRAEPQLSAWTRFAVRQADQVVLIAPAGSSPLPGRFERQLMEEPGFHYKRQQMALLHPPEARLPQPLRPWTQARKEIERVLPLRQGSLPDAGRLARFLTGHAVGLVLGGGGARGFAHLGVLRALQEAGIPIDLVGGNSMGALIGAQFVLGHGLDAIRQRVQAFAADGERPTLPVVSLLSGRRMEQGLKRLCLLDGVETQLDALWIPFFTTACNLSRACTTVLDEGPLWRAVLASNSPAGLLPPVPYNGDLLVDGAILDNVPVEAMRRRLGARLERRRGNGTVIAIDVDVAEPMTVGVDTQRLGAGDKLRAALRKEPSLPSIAQILYRAGHIGSMVQRGRMLSQADFCLEPPVSEFSLMAYKRAEAIVAAGYAHAQQRLEDPDWGALPRVR
jgi:predicted acylesterase/phospholipase RssA/CRP-like cAMP-binding protein